MESVSTGEAIKNKLPITGGIKEKIKSDTDVLIRFFDLLDKKVQMAKTTTNATNTADIAILMC